MCSVQGCDSWRRGAEYFDLPKDPQIRLQWIQFVSDSNNGQLSGLLNELSCADITVCREHFLEGCFEKPFETYCKVQLVRLKSSAVPTVRIKEEDVAALQQVPCETESSNEHTQCIPSGVLQQGEQKPPVNNNIVSELFPNTCPSCGHNLQTTTITQGMFITLNQLCLTCDYRNEFRREISASADEHLTPTENLEVTKKEEQTDEYTCESDTFGPTKDIRGTFKEEKDSAERVGSSEVPDQAKELHPEKDSEGKSRGKRVLDRPLTQQFCNDSGDQRTEPQAIQEKPVINENCLFRFFPHQCPSCSSKLQTEKVTVGTLITLTQQCLQCEYRNEFTRQTCATVSTTENQSSTPQSEPKQTDKLNNSETFELYKEESEDLIEEDSDEDWFPVKKPVPTKKTIEPCIQTGVLHQDEDKPPVNNNFVSELFPNTCRSCGYNLQTTSITEGMFITLTQQCPRCKYRVEFREINKSADESKTPTQSLDVTIKEEQTDEYICDTFGPTEDECGAFKTVEKSCESVATSDDLAKQQLPEKDSEGKSQGPYICNVCGKSCTNKGTLRRHVNTHDVNYEYQCIYCYETFKKKTEKLLHQQIHDYSPKPYKCLLCPETFPCRYERSYHLKTCHANRKQSKCEICGFIFENRHYLQRHMVVHTGDKPYKCSICERAFNQAGHLRSHMRLHTGERPFKCQHCDKAFNHNVSLKSHVQRYHKPDQ